MSAAPWPHEATDRVHELLAQLAGKELECQRLREQLQRATPADAERAKCATDIALELHMTGEPTWPEVLEHVRLAYRDRCAQLSADLSRHRG